MSLIEQPRVVPAEEEFKNITSPEDVLRKVADFCDTHMSGPKEVVADGTFAGNGTLHIENGKVFLIRHASSREHLTKSGKPASKDQLRDSSLMSGGAPEAGAIHTSANIDTWKVSRYGTTGIFQIPVPEFIDLARQGKLIIGNIGEAEIVISGDVAEKYLSDVQEEPQDESLDIVLPPL